MMETTRSPIAPYREENRSGRIRTGRVPMAQPQPFSEGIMGRSESVHRQLRLQMQPALEYHRRKIREATGGLHPYQATRYREHVRLIGQLVRLWKTLASGCENASQMQRPLGILQQSLKLHDEAEKTGQTLARALEEQEWAGSAKRRLQCLRSDSERISRMALQESFWNIRGIGLEDADHLAGWLKQIRHDAQTVLKAPLPGLEINGWD
ncbi:MAG: hypothetical protein KGH63_04690 [Candidatus Micrarchaeota archaeon]|nr:hypothetical protein [Candidatus Micrarchaeota archaeon]